MVERPAQNRVMRMEGAEQRRGSSMPLIRQKSRVVRPNRSGFPKSFEHVSS